MVAPPQGKVQPAAESRIHAVIGVERRRGSLMKGRSAKEEEEERGQFAPAAKAHYDISCEE